MCTTHTEQLEIREEQDIANEGRRRRNSNRQMRRITRKGKNFNNWENRTLHLNFERTWDHFESNPWVHSSLDIVWVISHVPACLTSLNPRVIKYFEHFWVDTKRLIKKIETWLFVIARLSSAHILFLALNATWREKIRFVRNEMKMIEC